MLGKFKTFTSFSTSDLGKARDFYTKKLGLEILVDIPGAIQFKTADGTKFMVYDKGNEHKSANFTVMYFEVDDLEKRVKELNEKDITMEQYPQMGTNEMGISDSGNGPKMAWFTDPGGNIIALMEVK